MWDVSQPSFDALLIATNQEVGEVVATYRQTSRKEFSQEELKFARAMCCLRQICVVKVG